MPRALLIALRLNLSPPSPPLALAIGDFAPSESALVTRRLAAQSHHRVKLSLAHLFDKKTRCAIADDREIAVAPAGVENHEIARQNRVRAQ